MKLYCKVLTASLMATLFYTGESQCIFNPDEVIPFCTEANNLGITYPAGISPDYYFQNSLGCLKSSDAPGGAWFIMQIEKSGDLQILMSHSQKTDVDFIALGPFKGDDKRDVLQYVCENQDSILLNNYFGEETNDLLDRISNNGCTDNIKEKISQMVTDINNPCFRGNFDEYPKGTITDCSASYYSDELCVIPNAKENEWYLLFISNWSLTPGEINFRKTGGDATTNCSIIVDAQSTGPYCVGDTIQLYVNNAPEEAQFMWTGPNGFVSTLKAPVIPDASVDNAGEYKLVMYTQEYEAPEVMVPVDVSGADTIVKKTVFLKPGKAYVFEDMSFTESGEYVFEKQTENGCEYEETLKLVVKRNIVPAICFTPNGDGDEDLWQIENIDGYPEAIVSIYDRWGKLLFQTSSYDNKTNAWDGKLNDKPCPSADYWYVIDLESIDRQVTGHFTLMR